MKFLIKFYLYLVRFFRSANPTSINITIPPSNIGGEELIIRGIVKPLFYRSSKNRLDEKAFLPPPTRMDVSVLRHDFTSSNFCKYHIKEKVLIKDNEYCGLAVIRAISIDYVNSKENCILENGERITVEIKSTPLDNLNFHSDILYSHSAISGEPNTLMRKIAKSLIEKSRYLHDPNPLEK